MIDNNLIILKRKSWIEKQIYAGQTHSLIMNEFDKIFSEFRKNIKLSDFAELAENILKEKKCIPTFLNYKGFPSPICTSVNNIIVHGVADDYLLQPGDVISIDVGVTYEGAIADAAFTWIYGENKDRRVHKLIKAGKEALYAGIKKVKVGNKIGAIGAAINKVGAHNNLSIITDYGGHGIDNNRLHAEPFVANHGPSTEGPIIYPGMSIAIEPMFVLGKSNKLKKLSDNWSLEAENISCHFEHSVTINDEGKVIIITENGLFDK